MTLIHKIFCTCVFLVVYSIHFGAMASDLNTVEQVAAAYPHLSLAGEWKFKPGKLSAQPNRVTMTDLNDWAEIQVPANWFLQGQDISGIAWYAKRFRLPAEFSGKRIRLSFKGVDYIAEVWLNGQYMGTHEGYFQPFAFDAEHAVRFDEDNLLLVKVNSPLEENREDWSLHKRYIKGIFGHHDTRPGGAWSSRGQEMNTGGIWAPVTLEAHDRVVVDTVRITPKLNLAKQSATAVVSANVNVVGNGDLPIKLQAILTPANFTSAQRIVKEIPFDLKPGSNSVMMRLDIDKPALWWPWDQGRPDLYRMQLNVVAGQRIIETQTTTFGFRSIEYDKARNEWRINGRRMFLRGTNYIASQWLSEMSPEKFAFDNALMKAANINIVRVHAHVTAEDFYRLCDENGMLVWQDFPLQWGYVEDEAFIENAIRQAREMIVAFYNHPSIVAWSLINEPAWEAKWMAEKYKHYVPDQNKILTDRLYQAIAPFDRSRYVHPFSASAEHPWLGWYSGSWLDYNLPTQISLVAEYGAAALPELNNLRKILAEEDLWPLTAQQWETWEFHNFYRKEPFKYAKIDMGNSPAEFIRNTQEYQAKLIKLAAESYRRQRYRPVSAIFQFMFCEDWPSMNWGIVDYWRSPKKGYFALQQAYQPILPSIRWEREAYRQGEKAAFELWAINDLPKDYRNAIASYSLKQGKNLLDVKKQKIDLLADSGQRIESLGWTDLPPGHYELVFTLSDADGSVLGINAHEFNIRP